MPNSGAKRLKTKRQTSYALHFLNILRVFVHCGNRPHPSGSDCYNINEHKPVMQWYNTVGMAWYLWTSMYACWYLCVTLPVISSLVSIFLLAYIRIHLIYHTDLFSRWFRPICVRHAIVKRRMDV